MLKKMRFISSGLFAMAVILASFTAWPRDPKIVVLDVEGMTCEVCPLTVKRAIKRVNGVVNVDVKYEGKAGGWAEVSYDPSKVKVEALMQATNEVGYPSKVRKK